MAQRTNDGLFDSEGWGESPSPRARERARERQRRKLEREQPVRTALGDARGRLRGMSWRSVLAGMVGLLALITVIGLAVLWPGDAPRAAAAQAGASKPIDARVDRSEIVRCPGPARQECRKLTITVDGRSAPLTLGPAATSPDIGAGRDIRVQRNAATPGATGSEPYAFAGLERGGTIWWLLGVFVVLVLALTRWRGALALVGFALSLLLVVKFVVPAIAAGSSPLLVAVIGSFAVMFITVVLTYGISPQSSAAILGIAASLLLAAGLGLLAANGAALDGTSSEYSGVLGQAGGISLKGVVLAGMVIGALGVLADMAVTQASAVMALRRANPEMGSRELFASAFGVGRDHLVATTHTLVLAYVGATLPLLLVIYSVQTPFGDAVNSEDVAEPIIATLIGVIALMVSVPLTTLLATALTAGATADSMPADHEGHSHAHAH